MVEIVSGTDVLLALLYAKGSTGKNNEPIAGTTKLEKFMFLISQETDLKETINKDYDFTPDNYGPCSHEIFDDIEMLKDAKFIEEKKRSIFSPLDEGDNEACHYSAVDSEVYPEHLLKVFSLIEKGKKIGEIMFNSLSPENQKKIVILKQRYNKRPVREIIRDVYTKYPEMIGESKIKKEVLA
ncbi:MAG: hypothetical protein OEZ45_13670 [Candidatus Aminicenantes bacterium]|nr:hypothetical protein [Candidatus Aminicenantes bacterium]